MMTFAASLVTCKAMLGLVLHYSGVQGLHAVKSYAQIGGTPALLHNHEYYILHLFAFEFHSPPRIFPALDSCRFAKC